jgi:hypothetical protein
MFILLINQPKKMSNIIYHTKISIELLELINLYGDIANIPTNKYKKFKKIIDLSKKNSVLIRSIFPNIDDPEMQKFYSITFNKELEKKMNSILNNSDLFESNYVKPPDEAPM